MSNNFTESPVTITNAGTGEIYCVSAKTDSEMKLMDAAWEIAKYYKGSIKIEIDMNREMRSLVMKITETHKHTMKTENH